jgi:hypothetical protein
VRTFLYTANDEHGQTISRQVRAADRNEAMAQLKDRGYTHIKLRDVSAAVYADAGATLMCVGAPSDDEADLDEGGLLEIPGLNAPLEPPVPPPIDPARAFNLAPVDLGPSTRRELPVWALPYDTWYYLKLPTSV